ncbi:hypothetical protein DI243_08200 [Paenibacillus polymyxa]|nr:hypothetical protein RE92_03755 [Paenibacillus polymyxa]QOH61389.1 hypothetical protein DI243_08200 [Paenibacillus polymyxa]
MSIIRIYMEADSIVSGTLQRDGLTTLSATNLIINTGLLVGATVVVEVINFNTSASSTSVKYNV